VKILPACVTNWKWQEQTRVITITHHKFKLLFLKYSVEAVWQVFEIIKKIGQKTANSQWQVWESVDMMELSFPSISKGHFCLFSSFLDSWNCSHIMLISYKQPFFWGEGGGCEIAHVAKFWKFFVTKFNEFLNKKKHSNFFPKISKKSLKTSRFLHMVQVGSQKV